MRPGLKMLVWYVALPIAVILAVTAVMQRSRRRDPEGAPDPAAAPGSPPSPAPPPQQPPPAPEVTSPQHRIPAAERVLATPFTPDTAPPGLAVRRRVWTTPLMLASFALVAALIEPSFPEMTHRYGRLVRDAAQDPSLVMPKQASIAVRPLFIVLLVLFALFASGSARRKMRLLAVSVGLYVTAAFLADVLLARLSAYGAPSPFVIAGNMIAGVIGVLVVAVAVFASARLPGDVRITKRYDHASRAPLALLGLGAILTLATVAAALAYAGGELTRASAIPLLGGAASVVVLSFIVLPMVLCALGWLVSLVRRRPKHGPWHSVAFIVPARDEEAFIGDCIASIADAAEAYPGYVHTYIVENGSSDATATVAEAALDAAAPKMDSTLLRCPPLGKSRALNVALGRCEADIVVRVDADTLVHRALLVRMVPHFWRARVGGSACCRCRAAAAGGSRTCAPSRRTTGWRSNAWRRARSIV
jgi:hypothetical protein